MSWPGWLCNWLHDGGWKHAGYSPQDWCKAQVGMQPSFYDLFHPQVLEHGSEALRFSATGFYSWCSDMGCMNPSVAWGTYSTVYGERNSQRVLLEPSIQPYFCSQLHFYLQLPEFLTFRTSLVKTCRLQLCLSPSFALQNCLRLHLTQGTKMKIQTAPRFSGVRRPRVEMVFPRMVVQLGDLLLVVHFHGFSG